MDTSGSMIEKTIMITFPEAPSIPSLGRILYLRFPIMSQSSIPSSHP